MIVIVVSHQRIGKTAERKLFRFIAFIEEIKMTNKRTVYGKKLLTAAVLVSMLHGGNLRLLKKPFHCIRSMLSSSQRRAQRMM